jgi:hypothetical protein
MFLASPLLIFLMAYDFYFFKKRSTFLNLILFIMTALSFAATGTRAHIIIAIIFAPFYMLLTGNFKTIIKALVLLFVVMFFVLTVTETRVLLESFFSTAETNNSMKIDLLAGYGEIFSNPLVLFFGQGFNAHEWSPELRNMIAIEIGASKTELTYIEIVRVFGILLGSTLIITIFMLLRSTKNLEDNLQWIYPGLSIFLVNAAINPYLFSVNGILPLGLISAIVYHFRRKDRHIKTKHNITTIVAKEK